MLTSRAPFLRTWRFPAPKPTYSLGLRAEGDRNAFPCTEPVHHHQPPLPMRTGLAPESVGRSSVAVGRHNSQIEHRTIDNPNLGACTILSGSDPTSDLAYRDAQWLLR